MTEILEKPKNSILNTIEFIKDTRKELKSVSWPGLNEVRGTTLVVIASVFFFGFFLFVVDFIVQSGMNLIDKAFSR
jgi:preprotein translocase SecE subunit